MEAHSESADLRQGFLLHANLQVQPLNIHVYISKSIRIISKYGLAPLKPQNIVRASLFHYNVGSGLVVKRSHNRHILTFVLLWKLLLVLYPY